MFLFQFLRSSGLEKGSCMPDGNTEYHSVSPEWTDAVRSSSDKDCKFKHRNWESFTSPPLVSSMAGDFTI